MKKLDSKLRSVDKYKGHETVRLKHFVYIDKNIAPLVQALWALDYETDYCCENNMGCAYITFIKSEQGLRFAQILLDNKIKFRGEAEKDDGRVTVRFLAEDLPVVTGIFQNFLYEKYHLSKFFVAPKE